MRNSPAQREKARQAIIDWRRNVRPHLPKCGAKRRRDGEPCQQLALENGRCYRHGGKTPKGEAWHKTDWAGVKSIAKLDRKLRDQRRAAKKRTRRLKEMSAAERKRYDAWLVSHKPGKSARAVARRDRIEAARIAAAMDAPEAINPEVAQIQAEIERLEALLRERDHNIFD